MRILNRKECQELDQTVKRRLKMSDELLMEGVASQCALLIFQKAVQKNINQVLVVCGPGNNGDDGFAIARHLSSMSFKCRVFGIEKGSARLKEFGIEIEPFSNFLDLSNTSKSAIVIDALFGIGLNRQVTEPFLSVIKKINKLSACKISVDVPSGLDVDKGVKLGDSVVADLTLTVAALKPGFFTADGPLMAGKIKLVHGGFSKNLFPDSQEKYFVLLPKEIRSWIPKRSPRSHKGSIGKCHLVAGSKEYLGAGRLTAIGALASGATFVQVYGDSELKDLLKDLPEVIFKGSSERLLEQVAEGDSVVIGPGVSDPGQLKTLLDGLIQRKHSKVILDAGAFVVMKGEKLKALSDWVWTPHPGEMAELLGMKIQEVEADRFSAVAKAQAAFGGQFLLKGFQPVFKTSQKDWWCLPYGDDRLGKAGTGDILSGLISGLMAQMLESSKATALAVYIHAAAAKLITRGRNRHSLLTSELPSAIGRVLC